MPAGLTAGCCYCHSRNLCRQQVIAWAGRALAGRLACQLLSDLRSLAIPSDSGAGDCRYGPGVPPDMANISWAAPNKNECRARHRVVALDTGLPGPGLPVV